MKKEIRVTKGQFERLIEQVHNQKYGKTLKENVGAMGEAAGYSNTPSSSPGVGAAEGLAVIIQFLERAWKYVTDPTEKSDISKALNAAKAKQASGGEGEMAEVAGYSHTPSSSPGVGAAEGLAVIINGVQKAWKYINDPQTKAAVKKTLAAIGSAAGSATTVGTRESRERKKPVISNKPVQKLVRPKR